MTMRKARQARLVSDKSQWYCSDIAQQEYNNIILSNVSPLKLPDNSCSISLKDFADPTNLLISSHTE